MIFKDKSVIITGGSEGVGAAAARLFAEAGANLMLVARNRKNLEAIAAELRDKSRVEIFPMDVSDADSCEDLIKKTQFEFGRIDVLVNNAGFQARGYVESVTAEDLGRTIDVNLRAPIMLTRLALPHIREAGGGAIINVASLAGRTPVPGSAAYSASKFGLRAFTFSLAEEIRDSGIKLAVVSPGPISTQFILADIDKTSDLTFSQPISSAGDASHQRRIDDAELPDAVARQGVASGARAQGQPREEGTKGQGEGQVVGDENLEQNGGPQGETRAAG
jgi:short-subunit dehydrogenase